MRHAMIVLCATLAFAGAACTARSPEEVAEALRQATANALHVADASTIEVVASEQKASKWVWKARADGKSYDCDADDMMRLPQCRAES